MMNFNISTTEISALSSGTLILILAYIAIRMVKSLRAPKPVSGGGGMSMSLREGPDVVGALYVVAIELIAAYMLRTTPLGSSLVAVWDRLETDLGAKIAWNTVPFLFIALFLWFTLNPPSLVAKYRLARLWKILLMVTILVLSLSASWVAVVLQFLSGVFIFVINIVIFLLNFLWTIHFGVG